MTINKCICKITTGVGISKKYALAGAYELVGLAYPINMHWQVHMRWSNEGLEYLSPGVYAKFVLEQ